MKEYLHFLIPIFLGLVPYSMGYGPRPPHEAPERAYGTMGKHPLDPLTPSEIKTAVTVLENSKKGNNFTYIYHHIWLQEPPKAVLIPYFRKGVDPPAGIYPRKAFLSVTRVDTQTVYEAVINVNSRSIESYIRIDNVVPPLPFHEMGNADLDPVRAHPEVKSRCEALGYSNMDLIYGASWPIGYVNDRPEYANKRVVQYYMFAQNFKEDNYNAHPLDFVVITDLFSGKLLEIEDLPTHDSYDRNNTGNTAPHGEGNFHYSLLGGEGFLRKGDKPITTDSPAGVSYRVEGNEISWQKWKMRVGFTGREGMILYTLSYKDGGKARPIMYRGSLVEMFTPYGDARPPYHRKTAFDIGEVGLGYETVIQNLNEEVLGKAHFIDQFAHNSKGTVTIYSKAISVREEDAGILWKHVDYRTGKGLTTRSHRLAVTNYATLGHYDFVFSWFFYQDGSIQFQAQLTGIPSVNMLALGATPFGFGTQVSPQVNAQYHHHFFTARLDLDIDGDKNTVSTKDVVPLSQPTGSTKNKYGQGFIVNETKLCTAEEGRTNYSPKTGRTWVISNPQNIHPYTKTPMGWKFMPMNTPSIKFKADSPIRPRCAFLDFDTWVTPYKDDQIFPGGLYLNETGLPEWVEEDTEANIQNTDVVFWNTFSVLHIVRVEDYPTMPVELAGFWLKPYNFFKENPALDVRPTGK